MSKSVVVIGSQWGDEGKGKVVDWLTKQANAVVRFQGGHNAGHTLVIDKQKIVLHLLPSGVLHENVVSCLGNGMVISLPHLLAEIAALNEQGKEIESRLKISNCAQVLLPYHVALDQAREAKLGNKLIGTTCRGIGPAYEDKVARRGIRIMDLFADADVLQAKLQSLAHYHNFLLTNYYQKDSIDCSKVLADLLDCAKRIKPMVCDVGELLAKQIANDGKVIFEGAQGAALDIDHGTYPFVTSSNTTAGQAAIGSGIGPNYLNHILGITKAYSTRVGSGPLPTEITDSNGQALAAIGDEKGATTGRDRRCGWLDMVALKQSIQVNSLTSICLTKLDVLDTFETIKICTAYNYQGQVLTRLPNQVEVLQNCVPIYEEHPGWQVKTAGMKDWHLLPENAKKYINRISELANLEISLISTSPERNDFIVIKNVFDVCHQDSLAVC